MSFEDMDIPQEDLNDESEEIVSTTPGKFDKMLGDNSRKYRLSGKFKEWFLDYSSSCTELCHISQTVSNLYRDVSFMPCTRRIQVRIQKWQPLSVQPWNIIRTEIRP